MSSPERIDHEGDAGVRRPAQRGSTLSLLMRFGAVGVLTAIIHYGLLYLGVEFAGLGSTVASSLGFVVAVIVNYLLHYSWTFGETAPHGSTLWRYLVMIACGFLLNGGVMYVGTVGLSVNYLLSQLVALGVVVTWNFLIANYWVFSR